MFYLKCYHREKLKMFKALPAPSPKVSKYNKYSVDVVVAIVVFVNLGCS